MITLKSRKKKHSVKYGANFLNQPGSFYRENPITNNQISSNNNVSENTIIQEGIDMSGYDIFDWCEEHGYKDLSRGEMCKTINNYYIICFLDDVEPDGYFEIYDLDEGSFIAAVDIDGLLEYDTSLTEEDVESFRKSLIINDDDDDDDDEDFEEQDSEPFKITEENFEELFSFIQKEIENNLKENGKSAPIEFDDIETNSNSISFRLTYFKPGVEPMYAPYDYFTFTVHYADDYAFSIEEAKNSIRSQIEREMPEFIAYVLNYDSSDPKRFLDENDDFDNNEDWFELEEIQLGLPSLGAVARELNLKIKDFDKADWFDDFERKLGKKIKALYADPDGDYAVVKNMDNTFDIYAFYKDRF